MTVDPQALDLPGYRDATLIGTGSTSLVFRAVQTRLNRTVAIKVLLVDDDATVHRQYQRELETTVLLSSQPHIVSIIDTGTTGNGSPYIVMEYCPGGSYAQILRQRGPLPVDEVVSLGAKIADALQAAHDVGVLHRDVKPSNILHTAFGPALADFGIARAPHQLLGTVSMDRMTPHHASPEALRRDPQSGSSDLYSLASTMWHLLAGRPPFADPQRPSPDLAELLHRVLTEPAPPVPRSDVPAWLQHELARALAKEPTHRHPSAHTFAEMLSYHAYQERDAAAEPARPPGPVLPSALPPAPAPAAPMASAPAAPMAAPHSAFRWPAAAPTRRSGLAAEPVAPEDPAVAEVAAEATITWQGQPTDRSSGTDTAGAPPAGPAAVAAPAPPVNTSTPVPQTPAPPAWAPPASAPPASLPPGSAPPASVPPASLPSASLPSASAPPAPPQTRPQLPLSTAHRPSWTPPPAPASGRRRILVGVAAASALLVIVAIGLVVALHGGAPSTNASGGRSPGPTHTLTLEPAATGTPGHVTLVDHHTSVTLTWTDPTAGEVQFVVLGGRSGTEPTVQKVLTPGTTTLTIDGLKTTIDYCYVVMAIYSVRTYARSTQVCTSRY
jgi:serine/threonine protein kinase